MNFTQRRTNEPPLNPSVQPLVASLPCVRSGIVRRESWRELTRHATDSTNSLCSEREAGDTAEARASASSSGASSASASGHISASGGDSISRGSGGSGSGGGNGSDAGSSSNDVGGGASAVLGDGQLHEIGLGLSGGWVDGESHALSAVRALLAVEPCWIR